MKKEKIKIKQNLIDGKQLEIQYLKDNDVWKFQAELQKLGFKDIPDYHLKIKEDREQGYYNRTLTIIRSLHSSETPANITEFSKSGKDFFGFIIYTEKTVYLPNFSRKEEMLDLKNCEKYGIEIAEHHGEHGAFLFFPGNLGVMLLLHPPVDELIADQELRRIVMKVLKEKYDIDTEEKNNDLMCRGLKIWGTTHGGTEGVAIICGAMNINLEEEMINKIITERPGHPIVKQGVSLNELTGKEINAREVVGAIIDEWMKITNSKPTDDLWQTKL